MATISRFEDLEIWLLAREQSKNVDTIIKSTPLNVDYELKNQISRSSGSVMDNIAEGFERSGNMEFKNFIIISKGSNGEVRSQLYRALDRNHISQDQFNLLCEKNIVLGNKLMAFIKYLQNSLHKGQRYK